jgi:ribosomal protein S18 acetylase RimI-like enzyme
MEIFDAKNTPFLLTTEAFEIYSQCMYQPTFDEYKNELSELASKPAISIFVCSYQQENAGIIVLTVLPGSSAEILGIAVKDKLKRLGIGKFMINSAAAVLGLKNITAETDDDAVNFYQRSGFAIQAFVRHFPDGDVTRYQCTLSLDTE